MNLTTAIEATAGTAVESETNTPVSREDILVMEILATQFKFALGSQSGQDADITGRFQCSITSRAVTGPAIAGINVGNTIDVASVMFTLQAFESTETGGGPALEMESIVHNFAGNGKGFLTAAKTIYVQVDGITGLGVTECRCRLLYRLVKVSAEELAGLLSQLSQ